MNLEDFKNKNKSSPKVLSEMNLSHDINIGKDILELLTSGMYLEPLTIYREYIQNAADSIESAVKIGLLDSVTAGKIDISVNYIDRSITIEDNGTGINEKYFSNILTSFGNSPKRGTDARGFRGIGRLAGLAYCQELIFYSKTDDDEYVNVLKYDCRKLKLALINTDNKLGLREIVKDITKLEKQENLSDKKRFFKVELRKISRLKNDLLLNNMEIEKYISEVCPVPFSPEFKFGNEIKNFLDKYQNLSEHNIYLNQKSQIYRMFRNTFDFNAKVSDHFNEFEKIKVIDNENNLLAIGFLLHHNYLGAINNNTGLTGLRARVGNIQIGENKIFLDLYPEARFNSWTIGELHVLNKKLTPNGRRDDFEKNNHYYNFLNYVSLITKSIANICRTKSSIRGQDKIIDFNNIKSAKREKAVTDILVEVRKHINDESKIKSIKSIIYEHILKF